MFVFVIRFDNIVYFMMFRFSSYILCVSIREKDRERAPTRYLYNVSQTKPNNNNNKMKEEKINNK